MPVPPEIVHDRDAEGQDRSGDVVDAEGPVQHGEHSQVDHVARGADQPELEELYPIPRLQGPLADPLRGLDRGHPCGLPLSIPKCSRITGARSRNAHCVRLPGLSGPQPTNTAGPSESPSPTDPFLPPPAWLMPPQSTHS